MTYSDICVHYVQSQMLNSTDFNHGQTTGAAPIFTRIVKYKAANIFRIFCLVRNQERIKSAVENEAKTAEQARRSMYYYPRSGKTHPDPLKPPLDTYKRACTRISRSMALIADSMENTASATASSTRTTLDSGEKFDC